jgi:hypothetical protein
MRKTTLVLIVCAVGYLLTNQVPDWYFYPVAVIIFAIGILAPGINAGTFIADWRTEIVTEQVGKWQRAVGLVMIYFYPPFLFLLTWLFTAMALFCIAGTFQSIYSLALAPAILFFGVSMRMGVNLERFNRAKFLEREYQKYLLEGPRRDVVT